MNVTEYLERKAMSVLGLLKAVPPTEARNEVFVNDIRRIQRNDLEEFDVWYQGKADELLRFYHYQDAVEYYTEPFYYKNKRSSFWAIASEERDIKRTHSGVPRAIVDTMVSMVGTPTIKLSIGDMDATQSLTDDLDDMGFWATLRNRQLPLTLVDGWGGWKLVWDTRFSDKPYLVYYRARDVRTYRRMGKVMGMTFIDWYTDGQKKWMVAETRSMSSRDTYRYEIEAFEVLGTDDALRLVDLSDIPEMFGIEPVTENMPDLFCAPCSFFADPTGKKEGRSIYEGKIDIFDDIDQNYSMAANTTRRSTPVEQFDIDFCERRKNGRPVMPSTFERKYIAIRGKQAGAMGSGPTSSNPVTVTQPQLNADMYIAMGQMLVSAAVIGMMSPAMLGVDHAAGKEAADSQRERNKVAIYFRNNITVSEADILKDILRKYLLAKEYIGNKTYTPKAYEISVKFDEFSDVSFENKLEAVGGAIASGVMTPETAVDYLYGTTMSDEAKATEAEWMHKLLDQAQQSQEEAMMGQMMEGDAVLEDGQGMPEGGEADAMASEAE